MSFIIWTGEHFCRNFHHWEKPYFYMWKVIVIHMFEIANQLLTHHTLYLVSWMNGNVFSFWNIDKVNLLLGRCVCNKQKNTWFPGDVEFLFSCPTQYLTCEVSSGTHGEKFHISVRPCITIFYIKCAQMRLNGWFIDFNWPCHLMPCCKMIFLFYFSVVVETIIIAKKMT